MSLESKGCVASRIRIPHLNHAECIALQINLYTRQWTSGTLAIPLTIAIQYNTTVLSDTITHSRMTMHNNYGLIE